MTFKGWMRSVDLIIAAELGVGVDDLIDQCWRDMYDDGLSPAQAAQPILENPYDYI